MKTKVISLICGMAALAMLSSCTKDNVQQSEPVSSTFDFTLEATLADLNPSGEDTKASATSVVRLSWKAGDRISVINLTTGKALGGSLTADATGTTTTFSGTLTGTVGSGDKLVFLYPSQGYTEEQDYQPVTIDLSNQAGSVKDGVPICVYATTSASSNVFNRASAKFNFLMSYIQFSFTGLEPGAAIKSVEVEDIGSTMTLSLTSDGIEATPSTGTITLTPENYKVSTSGSKAFYMSFAQSPKVSSRKITVMTDNEFKQGLFSGSALAVNNSYSAIVANFTDKSIPIADPVFKAYCVENFDANGDGVLSISEARAVTEISVSTDNIYSMKGIEFFTNLESLSCSCGYWGESDWETHGKLTSLDVSNNTALTYLNCRDNQLTSLDVSNNTKLIGLECDYNQITSLDVSNNTDLVGLHCTHNQITSLNFSNNTRLRNLFCDHNQLTTLDFSNNTQLYMLECNDNQLTSLNVRNNSALSRLWCDHNQLTSLDLSNTTALRDLHCGINQLTSLDLSNNTALINMTCYGNRLTSLDLSSNTALTYLDCEGNQLTSLDVSNNTALTDLSCYDNQLSRLDLSCNTALTSLCCQDNQLTSLDISGNTSLEILLCYNNLITELDLSENMSLSRLECSPMPELVKIILRPDQCIPNINPDRSPYNIPDSTIIEFKGNTDMGDGGDLED